MDLQYLGIKPAVPEGTCRPPYDPADVGGRVPTTDHLLGR